MMPSMKNPSRDMLEHLPHVRIKDFWVHCMRFFKKRRNVLAEGDSWFGYPPPWIVAGPSSNILDHLQHMEDFNLYRLERFGHRAIDMMNRRSKKKLKRALLASAGRLDFILWSAGGNDILDGDVLKKVVKPYQGGDWKESLDMPALHRTLDDVRGVYQELVRMRDRYAPKAIIVTHDYDVIDPTGKPAVLAGGGVRKGPWLKKYLGSKEEYPEGREIPEEHHQEFVSVMLLEFRKLLSEFEGDRFRVVSTYGTLNPGTEEHWLNEIHPTVEGFGILAKKFYLEGMGGAEPAP